MINTLLRLPAVLAHTGDSKSGLDRKIRKKLFTSPVRIGAHAVAWPASEVSLLVAARIAGQSDDAIRGLVERLEEGRKLALNTLAHEPQAAPAAGST